MVTSLRTFEGGPPLHEEELRAFEKKYGLSFPAAYAEFLLATTSFLSGLHSDELSPRMSES